MKSYAVKPLRSTDPLGMQDILMKRVQFEDDREHAEQRVLHSPEVMKKELPSQVWNPVVKYVFGASLIKYVRMLQI